MSRDVQFDDVRNAISRFGRRAALITVTDANTPHVVTSVMEVGEDRLTASVGSRTREHLISRPALTLLWSPVDDGEYQLILDGVADRVDDPDDRGVSSISIEVTRGIQHRLAGLPDGMPTCRAIGDGNDRS